MAKKELYAVRIEKNLLNDIQDIAEKRGETVTAIFEQALESFLSAPNIEDDTSIDPAEFEALKHRVERIEANLKEPKSKPQPEQLHPDDVGELVTLEQGAELTGYTKSTFERKKSFAGIERKASRNKKALYSKAEILDKIGMK